ncbi:hypothetical protein P4I81_04355 [Bacillus cereus]|uniref:Gp5 n=2 Tax=Lwoffvirus TP21 TaxID=57478 RepID=B8R870_9CAUD|nr:MULTISPECIES: hypothetical protein [Bacillus cereus group]YP_002333566.1 gp5 [Bacillus phage TP21-L]ANT40080.1 hypothetical protein BMBtpLA3_45 [Bacillus phage BMBtpLA3]MEB8636838.1 hypothetical protein [Bacillus cereus]ACJ70531.1 gp5 [Bacillus phage TP21-L]EXY08844.1 hypothetical protein BF15_04455 [Bacillus thuringiensis]MEB8743237.1 hypothetical protein [Bacillus cereus]
MKGLEQQDKVSLVGALLGVLGSASQEVDQTLLDEKMTILNAVTDDTTPRQRRESLKKVTELILKSL